MSTEKSDLRRRIDEIPGDDGWWHSSGADTFEELAQWLIGRGLSEDGALEVLGSAFAAVANEYGD